MSNQTNQPIPKFIENELIKCDHCGKIKPCFYGPYDDFICEKCADEFIRSICTCTTCVNNQTCEFAFDNYNIYGDCLAIK